MRAYRNGFVVAGISALLLVAGASARPIPYGLYVGNPNGNEAKPMAKFQADWDASVAQLARPPQFFGTFTDFGQDWGKWPANAGWAAWSWKQSGRAKDLKPVIGIKLSTNAYWNRQNDAFREIIAGQHDQVYSDVVAKWRDAGFKELRFRISYEFNGNFMPDNFGKDKATLALWRQAFSHVADVMHAVPNVKVLVVWNPADINWASHGIAETYPGDQYVDVIATDIYTPLYPQSMKDWSGGPKAANVVEWARNDANRVHFWDYPGATEWSKTGGGWGLMQMLDFARQHDKPFGIGETGVGSQNPKTGPADDALFPAYLKKRLQRFMQSGGVVDHVVIWDVNVGDGAWKFTGVPAKATTAAAWRAFLDPRPAPPDGRLDLAPSAPADGKSRP